MTCRCRSHRANRRPLRSADTTRSIQRHSRCGTTDDTARDRRTHGDSPCRRAGTFARPRSGSARCRGLPWRLPSDLPDIRCRMPRVVRRCRPAARRRRMRAACCRAIRPTAREPARQRPMLQVRALARGIGVSYATSVGGRCLPPACSNRKKQARVAIEETSKFRPFLTRSHACPPDRGHCVDRARGQLGGRASPAGSGLGTRDSGLGARDSGLGIRDSVDSRTSGHWGLGIRDSDDVVPPSGGRHARIRAKLKAES